MPTKKISGFIACLTTAISSCSLYGSSHPLIQEFAARAVTLLPGVCKNNTFSIVTLGDSLIINDSPFTAKGIHVESLMKRMKKKRVNRIVFSLGLGAEECRGFIVNVASHDPLVASPHISVGTVEVKFREGDDVGAATLMDEGAAKVKEAIAVASKTTEPDMAGLEDAVVSFLSALKRESKILRVVSPVKNYDQYTYVHATNVSVLTIFQAESAGVKGEDLRDIGLAGLLHDVGKMFVPPEVLDKPGNLDDREWDAMKQHPLRGALYLSRLDDVPPLAAVVAFEHHMKFDGSGYPGTRRIARTQHIVSQMVAIADFFDALRTERPYRKPLDIGKIAGMLREGAQRREFNPALVDSFLTALSETTCVV